MNNHPRDFVIFSTADWDNPFWTNKQHTAQRLAERGHRVLYIESLGLRAPTLKTKDLRRIFKRLLSFFKGTRKVHSHIWIYSPLVIPFHRFKTVRLINHLLLQGLLKFFVFKLRFKKIIAWTYNPLVLNYMKSLGPNMMIYHSVDDLSAAPGIDSSVILKEEVKLLQSIDLVFCTSLKIYEHCQKIAKSKAFYFPNVVDYDHFSQAKQPESFEGEPHDLQGISHPRIGLIGAVSEYKVDLPLICRVAKERPSWNWIIIGQVGEGQPGSKVDELNKYPNIFLLGPKDYKDLPSYLAFFDVCTIPCPVNDYTESMFPMKFFEYMAATKPIVARGIHSLKDYKDVHYSYHTVDEFLSRTSEAITKGIKNPDQGDKLARENTWEKRLEKMFKLINSHRTYSREHVRDHTNSFKA